ncbi:class I SAM-dependent methyltransferase [Nocardia mexicana]|uniref:O-methyltransferase involved in polyketide biosynthesis n=1 Tax=Nocardia mexicana TaxID=279262 RepID=A0A370H0R7_9NOCA|nr:class I SAM-dependent methyltransferase [Nocardia mexicana]RDI49596.1 O-methyltransferase involved in polyketide biosynthesis [Nocardia mexicana]
MEKVRFTEEKATMLATLYGRALDYRRDDPILGDEEADKAVRRIDYDFGSLGITADGAAGVAMRAKIIDDWAAEYLLEHPDAIVLHLGCGMDSRVFRFDPPPTVEWFDIDYPEVVELRTRIYPDRAHYHTIGTPVTELDWLDRIPSDRPALIVAEGLTMYLDPAEGGELLRQLVAKFPSGHLICDVFSRLGIKMQKANPVVRKSGSTLHWGIDDPAELERFGLHPVSCTDATDWVRTRTDANQPPDYSRGLRLQLAAIRYIPPLRRLARICRWRF